MTLPGSWRSPLDPERVMRAWVTHWECDDPSQREEQLAVEEPFEVQVNTRRLAMIMRTPGHDDELAAGFLLSEGAIADAGDVRGVEGVVDKDGLPLENVSNVLLTADAAKRGLDGQSGATFERRFAVSASCGLCGKYSIADVLGVHPPLTPDTTRFPATVLYELAAHMRTHQDVFTYTGGLHAAGLFDQQGELQLLREDVGRHNAVDKLVGYGLLHNMLPYERYLLLVSGRTSFEIIQKALVARIPCVAAISAPSSLAVDFADQCGITLIGFLRNRSMNVYTHANRIV